MWEKILLMILGEIIKSIFKFLPTVWNFFVEAWRGFAQHDMRPDLNPREKFWAYLFAGFEYYLLAVLGITTTLYYFCHVLSISLLCPEIWKSLIYTVAMSIWLVFIHLWIIPSMFSIQKIAKSRRLSLN